MKRIVSVLMVCVLLICMVPLYAFADEVQTTPMYRLYNPNSGEHFYTGSVEEKENLVSVGWNYEGIAWNAPIQDGDPVYRLYNPNSGDHHYTMSWQEVQMLEGYGWSYEGVAWNSVEASDPTAVPLYRLYNPNAECGIHHYTTSMEERDNLVAVGWILEGIGWFGAGDHQHEFKAATCTEPKTCKVCGATEGNALGHSYKDATCTAPKTCSKCGATEGSAAGHSWKDATCTTPKTCSNCGATEGSIAEHDYQNGICTGCGTEEVITHPIETGTGYAITVSSDGTEISCYQISSDELYFTGYSTEKPAMGYYVFREYNGTTYYAPAPSWGWLSVSSYTISGKTVQLMVGPETMELELISENQYKVTKGVEFIPAGTVFTFGSDMCSFMGHLYERSCEDDVTCMYCGHVKCEGGLGHEYGENDICFRCYAAMRPSN